MKRRTNRQGREDTDALAKAQRKVNSGAKGGCWKVSLQCDNQCGNESSFHSQRQQGESQTKEESGEDEKKSKRIQKNRVEREVEKRRSEGGGGEVGTREWNKRLWVDGVCLRGTTES